MGAKKKLKLSSGFFVRLANQPLVKEELKYYSSYPFLANVCSHIYVHGHQHIHAHKGYTMRTVRLVECCKEARRGVLHQELHWNPIASAEKLLVSATKKNIRLKYLSILLKTKYVPEYMGLS